MGKKEARDRLGCVGLYRLCKGYVCFPCDFYKTKSCFLLFSVDFLQLRFKCSDSVTQFNPVRGFLLRVSSDPNIFRKKFRGTVLSSQSCLCADPRRG